ncbi:latrophilin Cirl-like [Mya arenaria]|uniref:latrophilin Cirl-like n=1 Tax=Mya arenaria TaxID=6604 RepID=UPI0022E298A2|nr:latrophilin Cirl-like [Mya arenaria]
MGINMNLCACVVLFVTVSITTVYCDVILCEGSTGYIECPFPSRIVIYAASYGRTRLDVCPDSNIYTLRCRARGTLRRVRATCQGRNLCQIRANNDEYGDPCEGTNKYLNVEGADIHAAVLAERMQKLEKERDTLRDNVPYLQSQSMRNNLVFTGLSEGHTDWNEHADATEPKLR